MSDEEAIAKQEIAKATGKGIDLADKFGGFFSRVFGQPIADTVGRFWGDKIAVERRINQIALIDKYNKKVEEAGITDFKPLRLKVGVPLLEVASLEDDPNIQEMYANLLLSAHEKLDSDIEKKHVSVLSEMSGLEAQLLQFLFEYKYTEDAYPEHQKISFGIKQYRAYKIGDLKQYANVDEDEIRSLMRLGILKSVKVEMRLDFGSELGVRPERTKFGIYPDIEQTAFTNFGIDLATRVIEGKSMSLKAKEAERDF